MRKILPNNLRVYVTSGKKSDYIQYNIDLYNDKNETTMYIYMYNTGVCIATFKDQAFSAINLST